MRSVAEYVATLPDVRGAAAAGRGRRRRRRATCRARLAPYVDRGVSLSSATDVMIVSPDGVVLAATDPSRVGDRADLGDSDALEGRGWTGDVEPDGERAVAAHAPVIAEGRRRCSGSWRPRRPTRRVADQVATAAPDLALYLGLGALLGLGGHLGRVAGGAPLDPRPGHRPSWPTSPTTARRCCTRSARASSASAPTAG